MKWFKFQGVISYLFVALFCLVLMPTFSRHRKQQLTIYAGAIQFGFTT